MDDNGSSRTSAEIRRQIGPRGLVTWQGTGDTPGNTKTPSSCIDGGHSPGSPVTEQTVPFSLSIFKLCVGPCTDGGHTPGAPDTGALRDFLEVSDHADPEK